MFWLMESSWGLVDYLLRFLVSRVVAFFTLLCVILINKWNEIHQKLLDSFHLTGNPFICEYNASS